MKRTGTTNRWAASNCVWALIASIALATSCSRKKDNSVFLVTNDALPASAANRLMQIRDELNETFDHDWAGEYYYGDGVGCNVTLALSPKAGVVYTYHACLGLCDSNMGTIAEVLGDRIRINWDDDPSKSNWAKREIANEMVRVQWGQCHYLIPEQRLVKFCNDVNAGREPYYRLWPLSDRSPFYLLRRAELKNAVSGHPQVPTQFRRYLLGRAVQAEITQVLSKVSAPNRADIYKAEINAGSEAGLLEQMELHPDWDDAPSWDAVVVSVSPQKCVVEIADSPASTSIHPKAGQRLSTRLQFIDSDPGLYPRELTRVAPGTVVGPAVARVTTAEN